MSEARVCSLPPVWSPDAQVLILGSMPGERSLAAQQYYAHPHNQFWPIMGRLFGAGPDLEYRRRLEVLRARRVALWDVLESCERLGSLDSSIVSASEQPNDIAGHLRRSKSLRAVFLNGRKAEQSFRRFVLPELLQIQPSLKVELLPSTSPAHAGMSRDDKIRAWMRICEYLAAPASCRIRTMTAKKKPEAPKPKEQPQAEPAAEAPKRGIFKQPLSKPQPWQFGGRGARTDVSAGDKPAPDAERRGGKSRKVH